ncbi:MAG: sterol desaturase family protein [Planctomycetaceae bacterium]|nr:sterol desaturase family protein [Planctomycetaceae bacterium]
MSDAIPSSRLFVSHDDMPADVWEQNVLGKTRLANHLVPFYVFVPVVIGLAAWGLLLDHVSPLRFGLALLAAIPLWTINEYVTHRFVFHYEGKSELTRKLVYTMHTGHHEYPNDKRFMLIGLNVSIPNTIITGVLFWLIVGDLWTGLLAGWLCCYLFYDWLHFATHVYNFDNRIFRLLKKHHMQHHFKYNDKNFGVVSSLWDWIVGTKLRKQQVESELPTGSSDMIPDELQRQ